MSEKFRHNNRKYRISGNNSATATPSSANGRPSAARSSDEESYLSDFDRFDEIEPGTAAGEGEGAGGLFVVGEAITDKLQLSSEFESDVAGGDGDSSEGGEEEVREEEGLQVSPPSRPTRGMRMMKTKTGSMMENDDDESDDEIDEYYESDFSSVSPSHPLTSLRGDTAESDIYDESFDPLSPTKQDSPTRPSAPTGSGVGSKSKVKSKKKKSKQPAVASASSDLKNAEALAAASHPETLSDRRDSEDALINPLSEFSSITFVDSVVTDETAILLGNQDLQDSSANNSQSKEKKNAMASKGTKKPKSTSSHVTWKAEGSGKSNNSSSSNNKLTKKVPNGVPIQPRSRPNSQSNAPVAGGGVAMVSSSSANNSPSAPSGKSISSSKRAVNHQSTSVSNNNSNSKPGKASGTISVMTTSSASTQLPAVKFQVLKLSASSTSATATATATGTIAGSSAATGTGTATNTGGGAISLTGSVSVLTQGSSSVIKTVTGGPSYLSSVLPQNPITSTVGQRNSLPVNELQRQLTLTLRRLDEYKQQNAELREQLNGSTIYGIIEKLKHEMIDKDQRIQELLNENNALKYVSRHQGKQLVEVEIAKQYEPELVDIQTKYLEVMNEQLKNVRNKLNQAREGEKRWQGKSEKQEHLITKLRTKVLKWKTRVKELEEMMKNMRKSPEDHGLNDIDVTSSGMEVSTASAAGPSISISSAPIATSAEHWVKMEKNFQVQIKSLQRDLQHKKQEGVDHEKSKKLLEEELKKRELFGRHQLNALRVLRHDYEHLLEGNRQLMQAAALYNRDTALPIKKETKKVVEEPAVVNLIPEPVEEPMVVNAKLGLMADDGEDMDSFAPQYGDEPDEGAAGNDRDTTTFLTRMEDNAVEYNGKQGEEDEGEEEDEEEGEDEDTFSNQYDHAVLTDAY